MAKSFGDVAKHPLVIAAFSLALGLGSRIVDGRVTAALLESRVKTVETKIEEDQKRHEKTAEVMIDLGKIVERLQAHQSDTDRRVSTLEGRPSARSN